MQPDDQALLIDMLVAAREAKLLTSEITPHEFTGSRLHQLAVERLIQNVGEAASRLSPEAQALVPHVPWHDVVGMRNRLVHDYNRVDVAKVWQVVTDDLEELISAIMRLLPPEPGAA